MSVPKYRAWLKNKNEMRSVKSINFEESHSAFGPFPPHVVVEGWCEMFTLGDEAVLMQHTNMSDPERTNIYEGDVVSYPHEIYPVRLIEYENGSPKMVIPGLHSDKKYLENVISEIKVLGDVYQNPELLSDNVRKEGDF